MNKLLVKKIAVGAVTAAVMFPLTVLAQVADPEAEALWGLGYATATGLTSTDVRETVASVIKAFMGLLGIVAVVIILLGGFKWMMSQGSPDKVEEAKKLMISGVIGLVIILCSYALAQFVLSALNKATGGT